MYSSAAEMVGHFYSPLQRIWLERMRAAEGARKRFDTIAKTCNDFYESQKGFMWRDDQFFNGSLPEPKFKITIAKAFEFVALYGPHLFWQYAARKVFSPERVEVPPEMFPSQEEAQQYFMQEHQADIIQDFVNDMLAKYLDWSQREQPGGGLIVHGMNAIQEALLTGMGLLWPETYMPPGSDAKYTKLSYGSVNEILVDPDCRDPLWETAGYIARRHTSPIWQVENLFGLPRGALAGKGTAESAEMMVRNSSNHGDRSHSQKTFDKITWYEIWSRVGVGPRTNALNHHMIDMFDDELGDYAYICIADGVPYPLNAPPDSFFGEDAATGDSVREMFQWRCTNFGDPFPYWKDSRWPVSVLTFYPMMNSAWPLAPLAPGLGELIAINVLTSAYVDIAWTNRQQILAFASSAQESLKALESDEAFVKLPLNEHLHRSVHEVAQFLQRPPAQQDLLQAIGILADNFAKRVGLSELLYGDSPTQIRVASDSRQKQEALSIRPEKMSLDVARFLTSGSQLELFLAIAYVDGSSIAHLVGEFGAGKWNEILSSLPLEVIVREFKATVEASEVRRPNKERDLANAQSQQQYLLPISQAFAQQTSKTGPLNDLVAQLHHSMEAQGDPVQFDSWSPPADEEQQEMQKQDFLAELRKKLADAASKQAAAQKSMAQAAQTMMESRLPGGLIGEAKHEQDMRHKEESHDQQMLHEEQAQIQRLLFSDMEAEQELDAAREQQKVKARANGVATARA